MLVRAPLTTAGATPPPSLLSGYELDGILRDESKETSEGHWVIYEYEMGFRYFSHNGFFIIP